MKHIQIMVLFAAASMFSINSISVGDKLAENYTVVPIPNDSTFCATVNCLKKNPLSKHDMLVKCPDWNAEFEEDVDYPSWIADIYKVRNVFKICEQYLLGEPCNFNIYEPDSGFFDESVMQWELNLLDITRLRCQIKGHRAALLFDGDRPIEYSDSPNVLCLGIEEGTLYSNGDEVVKHSRCVTPCPPKIGNLIPKFYPRVNATVGVNDAYVTCNLLGQYIKLDDRIVHLVPLRCTLNDDKVPTWTVNATDQSGRKYPVNFNTADLACTEESLTPIPEEDEESNFVIFGPGRLTYLYALGFVVVFHGGRIVVVYLVNRCCCCCSE